MPVSERQLAAFADQLPRRIPLDTSPRHLAGAGDARHVTHALAAAGWARTSDPFSPEVILRSPQGRCTLHFDPQSVTSAWWRLRGPSPPTPSRAGTPSSVTSCPPRSSAASPTLSPARRRPGRRARSRPSSRRDGC
ncbi:hypothetical protein SRIMHP_03415 [Streptomyces rimosus subsp. rimosus]|uniref:Uncharacterized protein n=1 Tax=Streptomyces rimosus subsp. rimosus TaxID=132474 RepID=A0ABY3YV09_STRRM|nr:hypothetical protein SRIMR7_03420 [Streptomyces rimosus subsp. rimosus]UTH93163.1 hypothetical protein SRIMHP_03415 [Streptomyces rimosus subsp. rimosus]